MDQHASEGDKILLIGISSSIRPSLIKYLHEDFEIVEADEGESGWAMLLTDSDIHLVITDGNTTKLEGNELIQRIRSHPDPQINHLPILMLTSSHEEKAREKAYESGVSDFIVKPPEKVQLLAQIRVYVDSYRKRNPVQTYPAHDLPHLVLDPVTRLTSEQYFLLKGQQDIAFAKRHENNLSIVAVGIDQFSDCLQKYGDVIGSELLKYIAEILKSALRSEDTVSMILPNNFAILAASTGRLEGTVFCERIRKLVAKQEFVSDNISLPISVTLGLVSLKTDGFQDIDSGLHMAMQRVAKGQKQGGNRIVARESNGSIEKDASTGITDIHEALALLEQGEEDKVRDSLPRLLQKMLPLLALANREYQWGFDSVIDNIMQKLLEETSSVD